MTHFVTLLSKLDLLVNPPDRLSAWKSGTLLEYEAQVEERNRLVTMLAVAGIVCITVLLAPF
jgi:hypothetical protein